jgi:two-component system NtrC family response regulator
MSGILLADDEPAFQRLTGNWLRGLGHEVRVAGDGDAARRMFAQAPADVVLLDLAMPPHHDPEAGLALIAAFAPAPVIVMTGHADHDMALKAVDAGAWDFLAKPVDPDLLRIVVGRAAERARLARELADLQARSGAGEDMGLVGNSPAMAALRDLIRRIAPTRLPALILGPSGTGKELVARAIHDQSPRAGKRLVTIHCGAVPAELLESELFGHVKGSFTGATSDRPGLVEAADGGTLFFDEIGEMPAAMQVKLLRFLNDGSYQPVGARELRTADVRLVAATHRDLTTMVDTGEFREDLYYRLRGMILRTPSLAERRTDIPLLASLFLRRISQGEARFTPTAQHWLIAREWKGNVRELRSAVECAAALTFPTATGSTIDVADLCFAVGEHGNEDLPIGAESGPLTLEQEIAALERLRIVEALERTARNHTHAARELGLSRAGLLKKLDRMGLR